METKRETRNDAKMKETKRNKKETKRLKRFIPKLQKEMLYKREWNDWNETVETEKDGNEKRLKRNESFMK